MKFNLISLIYLLGALQALILCIGININKPLEGTLKKTMSLVLVVLVVVMVYYIVILTEFVPLYAYVDSLGTAAWMALCPAYYLLCRSLVAPKKALPWTVVWLFSVSILFCIEGAANTLGFPHSLYSVLDNPLLFLDGWMLVFFSSSIFFVVKSIRLFKDREEEQLIREMIYFSYAILGFLLIFAGLYLVIREQYSYGFEYALIGLFEVFIFMFLYRVFKAMTFHTLFPLSKYSNQPIAKKELAQRALQLEQVMKTQEPYLNKELNLTALAQLTHISPNDLSQLFNLHYQSSFYEYINQARLSHVEKSLMDPAYAQYKITGIAELSGFKSKATFYKVFKEKHQMTPTEYLKKEKAEKG